MPLNGNPINTLINLAPLRVYGLAGVFFTMLTFHMGRFLPRGRQRSRNSYTHPSRPRRLSWCSWEKTKWVKKWRKGKEDRRQDKQQVSSERIDRHTTLNQQNTLSPAVTSQFSDMPAAKRGQSSGSSSRQNMNTLLFPVLVFTHFTACQTQPNVDVHLVMYQNPDLQHSDKEKLVCWEHCDRSTEAFHLIDWTLVPSFIYKKT